MKLLRAWFLEVPARFFVGTRETLEPIDPAILGRLRRIESTFLDAYFYSIRDPEPAALAAFLDRAPPEFRGFAYEGAGMGLAMVDAVTPWRAGCFQRFLEGPGARFAILMYVGLGWAIGRLGLNLDHSLSRLDPVLSWLTVDGYGFHNGFFSPRASYLGHRAPVHLLPFQRRVTDMGLGRSMWFGVANVRRMVEIIERFEPSRRADIWSGVGLASAYAGGRPVSELAVLLKAAGPARAEMARGASLAVLTRHLAGEPVPHTDEVASFYTRLPAETVTAVVSAVHAKYAALARRLPPGPDARLYQAFLAEVQAQVTPELTSSEADAGTPRAAHTRS